MNKTHWLLIGGVVVLVMLFAGALSSEDAWNALQSIFARGLE